ncbi:hypothetical protein RhiJN_27330 [Ceratobasidium sp. AG-Ba]|nr:hypothetical protein RhiJN_27330 [Ceratobasidium sp. AG-Ba]
MPTERADSSCVSGGAADWMLNEDRQTPCQVAESIVRVCTPTAQVQHLPVAARCSTLGSSNSESCCCSTVTYALVAGCLVCQTGKTNQLTTTYAAWLASCSKPLIGTIPPVVNSTYPPIDIPRWANIVPTDLSTTWNITLAQSAANYTAPLSTTSSSSSAIPSVSASPRAPPSAPPSDARESRFPAAPVAISCVVALLLVCAMATWLYKRRNRVSPSTRPTPDFVIDEPGSPVPASTLRDREEESKSSWPWKKKSKSKNGGSDPGKVDPFPFDYTPLAVDSLSPPSQYHQQHGHHGQYYDPYVVGSMSRLTLQQDESDAEQRRRERHEQRRHERRERRTRSSSETRPLQGGSYGRVSGETVRPSTASGSGGLRPQASSATLGVPPGYTSSPLLYPGSRSLAGTPVPGSQPPFGTVTPYLSPSTPIPSSSTPRPGGRSPVPPPSPRHSPNPVLETHLFHRLGTRPMSRLIFLLRLLDDRTTTRTRLKSSYPQKSTPNSEDAIQNSQSDAGNTVIEIETKP